MKVKPLLLIVPVLFLAGVGFFLWYLLAPSDEELIREVVTGMETTLSAPVRNDLQSQAETLSTLKNYLGEQVLVELPGYHYTGTFERQELLNDYFSVQRYFRSIKVVCSDVTVTFPEDRDGTAFVDLTVRVTLRGEEQEPQPVRLTMSDESGDWRVTGIAVPEHKKTPGP